MHVCLIASVNAFIHLCVSVCSSVFTHACVILLNHYCFIRSKVSAVLHAVIVTIMPLRAFKVSYLIFPYSSILV